MLEGSLFNLEHSGVSKRVSASKMDDLYLHLRNAMCNEKKMLLNLKKECKKEAFFLMALACGPICR